MHNFQFEVMAYHEGACYDAILELCNDIENDVFDLDEIIENEVKFIIWCSEDSSEDYMYDEIEGEKCDGYGLEEGEECEEMCYNGLYYVQVCWYGMKKIKKLYRE